MLPIGRWLERIRPVLDDGINLAAAEAEERDGLSRLLSIRDLDMRENLWALGDQPSKREAPDSFGRILSIHNSEVLRTDDTFTRLRSIENEIISKHRLD